MALTCPVILGKVHPLSEAQFAHNLNPTASSSALCCGSTHLTHPRERGCLFSKTSFYSPFLETKLDASGLYSLVTVSVPFTSLLSLTDAHSACSPSTGPVTRTRAFKLLKP